MLMVYGDPDESTLGWSDDHVTFGKCLAASGELVSCEGLADPVNATSVHRRPDGAVVTGGGSPRDTVLIGYYRIDCDGFERAVDLGGRIPGSGSSTIEIRPVMDVAGLEM